MDVPDLWCDKCGDLLNLNEHAVISVDDFRCYCGNLCCPDCEDCHLKCENCEKLVQPDLEEEYYTCAKCWRLYCGDCEDKCCWCN